MSHLHHCSAGKRVFAPGTGTGLSVSVPSLSARGRSTQQLYGHLTDGYRTRIRGCRDGLVEFVGQVAYSQDAGRPFADWVAAFRLSVSCWRAWKERLDRFLA